MKAIQIMMDEALLQRLDATSEVQLEGRSAVPRRAEEEYLLRRRSAEIHDRYAAAYGGDHGLGAEFEGWEDEGEWPE